MVKYRKFPRKPTARNDKRHAGPATAGASALGNRSNQRARKPLVEGVPLGSIVPRSFSEDPHLLILNQPTTAMAERFRRLAVRLDQMSVIGPKPPQVIIVTSAVPGDGKTFTAVNLALAMAEDKNCSVLLVDADLRRPSIGRYLMNPKPKIGLKEILAAEVSVEHAVVHMKNSKLRVLPSGDSSNGPLEFLRSNRLAEIFLEMRQNYDKIVVDTPPVVPFADAASILPHSDGALVVVKAGKTSKPMIEKTLEGLESGAVLGAVLNDVRYTPVERYYYKYDYTDPERYTKRRKKK